MMTALLGRELLALTSNSEDFRSLDLELSKAAWWPEVVESTVSRFENQAKSLTLGDLKFVLIVFYKATNRV